MARTARKPKGDDNGGTVPTKDFAGAVRAWHNDIKPALGQVGEAAQEASTAYKHIKKNCHIQPAAAKLAFKLAGTEDAKRDDFIRCFVGLMKEMKIPLESNDLVDQAERAAPAAKPKLVTVPTAHPSGDSDLAGNFTEATAEELAQQEGRGEPAPGTGAAALKAMAAENSKA